MNLHVFQFLFIITDLIRGFPCEEYTNRWVVEIHGGIRKAAEVAEAQGVEFVGHIFEDLYTFRHRSMPKRSVLPFSEGLVPDNDIKWMEQQRVIHRSLKSSVSIADPKWKSGEQWALVSMNADKVWEMLYCGENVTVAIVDDGIFYNNTDIIDNFAWNESFDVLDNDEDVSPSALNEHGTKCAGIVAASTNDFCGVGIAFRARLIGVRLFGQSPTTGDMEAMALSVQRFPSVDIFSCSWGPVDNTREIGWIEPLTKIAYQIGEKGRKGLGAIYVVASGSGGVYGDKCAYDEYVSDIHTITVTGVNRQGRSLYSSEPCDAIMVTAYSQDNNQYEDRIVTTNYGNAGCTDRFGDSSAATPAVSGILALVLDINPSLSWRDVQHLITQTGNSTFNSRPNDWKENAAGFRVSSSFGFGLINATAMATKAKRWVAVPYVVKCELRNDSITDIPGDTKIDLNSTCNICKLEHVEVFLNVTLTNCGRGRIKTDLISPQGTISNILPGRFDDSIVFSLNITVMSVHFWGENPVGIWTLRTTDAFPQFSTCNGTVVNWKLIIRGTKYVGGTEATSNATANTKHNSCIVEGEGKRAGDQNQLLWLLMLLLLLFIPFGIMIKLLCNKQKCQADRTENLSIQRDNLAFSERPV